MTNSVNTNETATRVEVIDIAQQLEARTSSATTLTGVFRNVFHYASFCEHNFKRNVANNGTELQDTTFTSDLSIAEFLRADTHRPSHYDRGSGRHHTASRKRVGT